MAFQYEILSGIITQEIFTVAVAILAVQGLMMLVKNNE